ncbi:nucleotidyltransferase [Myxococcota bacterium]|nr:nucleotidyltransferase [Myxococcota bacterium]
MGLGVNDILIGRRDDVLWLAARHGARDVKVCGAVARGEADPDSALHLVVDMEPGRSLFDVGAMRAELSQLLGREVVVLAERVQAPRLSPHAVRDAVRI